MSAPLFERRIRPLVLEALRDSRIVPVSGARQVGKTTLTTEIAAADRPMRSLTLDDALTRDAAERDPAGFIAGLDGPVLIDEIQHVPELLLEIKKTVDRDPTPGRFLLTGSADVLSSKRVIDALTGRIDRIRMWPLAQTEITGGALNVIDELFAGRAPQVSGVPVGHQAFSSIIAEGGYPDARVRAAGRRPRWFENYIDTALDRDLREIADARRIDDMGRLLRLLATQSANLLSYRAAGERLQMHHDTVQSYVTLLEQMFLVQRLPAWRPGLGAREAARPKAYVCDPGLLAFLLGADVERIEHDDQVIGKACETLVAVELLKHASWAQHDVRLHHYQRERGDIDLVLEDRAGNVAAVEVKAKASITARDWRSLTVLRDARGPRFKSGIVIYSGEQTVPLGDRLWAVPYAGLWA
jgi:predicted AAA+ superfamily ATPase